MWNKLLSPKCHYNHFVCFILFDLFAITLGNLSLLSESKVRIDVQWPASEKDDIPEFDETAENVLYMTSADKETYRCILPPEDTTGELLDESRNYKGPTPLELLKPLFSQLLCYFRIDSYWSYELCHGYYIRQFHDETNAKGRVSQEFYLGKYDPKDQFAAENRMIQNSSVLIGKLPTIRVEDAELPYWSMNMTDGTYCVLSEKPRSTRVFYACHPRGNNAMYSFREVSSCEYEVIVLTTVLCKHPAFRIEHFTEAVVNCYPMPGSPGKPRRLKKAEEDEKEAASAAAAKKIADSPSEKEVKDAIKVETKKDFVLKERPISIPHDQKLIDDVLSGAYCLRGGSGWWHFEFCYGKYVEQYHKTTDSKTVLFLGVWNEEKHLMWLEKHQNKKPKRDEEIKQISHFYTDGSFCSETGQSRNVEVKLRCKGDIGHPDSVSLYLEEPRTCEYILVVESPMFCSLFKLIDENGLTASLKAT